MGQRHQLFIIARVNGRFRGLAAVHHQWLYGASAVEACYRLIQTLEAAENRLAITHEIRWAKTLSESEWECEDEDYLPFPFIHTCLTTASSYDEAEPAYHMVHQLPFNMAFDGGDNNDGITVVDVTDLESFRYAFVNWHNGSKREVKPLTASQYLKAYGGRTGCGSLIQKLELRPLIDSDALASAWPNGYWESSKQQETSEEQVSHSRSTLRTAAMTRFLDEALSSSVDELPDEALSSSVDELPAILESASQLADFWPTLKSKLYDEPELVATSPGRCYLLSSTIKHDAIVDLSPFNLPIEDLNRLLLEFDLDAVNTLSLSGNCFVDEQTLRNVLAKYPELTSLHLLNTPQLKLETKVSLARTTNLTELMDTEILAIPFRDAPRPKGNEFKAPPVAFRDPSFSELYCYTEPALAQIMVVAPMDGLDHRTPGGGLYIDKVIKLGGDPFSYSLSYPLANVNLPPKDFLTGLTKFLRFYCCARHISSLESITDIGRMLAFSFATASDLNYGQGFKAGALSRQLYPRIDMWSKFMWDRQGHPRPERIAIGQWSLLLIAEPFYNRPHENDQMKDYHSAVRYAFITAAPAEETTPGQETAGTKLIRADFETYLSQVVTGSDAEATRKYLLDGWKKLLDNLKPNDPEYKLGLCDMDEVESYLRSDHYIGRDWKSLDDLLGEAKNKDD